ncbi:MAG: hypothetical protein R3B09_25505 [Nannocystaceae bacterium]
MIAVSSSTQNSSSTSSALGSPSSAEWRARTRAPSITARSPPPTRVIEGTRAWPKPSYS